MFNSDNTVPYLLQSVTGSTKNLMSSILFASKGKNMQAESDGSSELLSTPINLRGSRVSDMHDDSSSPQNYPYDPLTNYLTPRPRFLRYQPSRSSEEIQFIEDDCPSPDVQFMKGGKLFNGEENGGEERIEEKEHKRWGLMKIFKFIVFLGALVFYTYCITKSPTRSSPQVVENYVFEATSSGFDLGEWNDLEFQIGKEEVEYDDILQIKEEGVFFNQDLQEPETATDASGESVIEIEMLKKTADDKVEPNHEDPQESGTTTDVNEESFVEIETEKKTMDGQVERTQEDLDFLIKGVGIFHEMEKNPELQRTLKGAKISESPPSADLFFNSSTVPDEIKTRVEEFVEPSVGGGDAAHFTETDGEQIQEESTKPDGMKTAISMETMLLSCSIPLAVFFVQWLGSPSNAKPLPRKTEAVQEKIVEPVKWSPPRHEKRDHHHFSKSTCFVQTAEEDLRNTEPHTPIELSWKKKKNPDGETKTALAVKSLVTTTPARRSSRIRNKK